MQNILLDGLLTTFDFNSIWNSHLRQLKLIALKKET